VSVVLGVAVGALTAHFLALAGGHMFDSPLLQRRNYRDVLVPTAGGVLIVVAVLAIEAGRAVFGAVGVGETSSLTLARSEVLFAALGFGLLGLIDDVFGTQDARGFAGHLRAALRGELTTGLVKLLGGAGVAVVLVATPGFATGRRLLVDAVLIALAANLGNLLDRAPGRTIKAALVAYVPLGIVLGTGAVGVAIAPVIGASLALLVPDLRERLMLGDTGANVIGATLGLGVVLGRGETTRITALAVLVVANVMAEIVSFSDLIERVPPLRAIDHLGRSRGPRDEESSVPA
jgi:UDP-GlcNAc:undecaprenyl-phosphate GlcNAc-1-phosphate transferase